MSADRIFCYGPQRQAVVHFLHDIGGLVSEKCPHEINDADQLAGLEFVTFIVIDGHPNPIPQGMWERIVERGCIVIHVDDQYSRSRLIVRHHPGDCPETPPGDVGC